MRRDGIKRVSVGRDSCGGDHLSRQALPRARAASGRAPCWPLGACASCSRPRARSLSTGCATGIVPLRRCCSRASLTFGLRCALCRLPVLAGAQVILYLSCELWHDDLPLQAPRDPEWSSGRFEEELGVYRCVRSPAAAGSCDVAPARMPPCTSVHVGVAHASCLRKLHWLWHCCRMLRCDAARHSCGKRSV